jgi:ribA/ribD-fused uncharacterized protein
MNLLIDEADIPEFQGENRFLSNFWPGPFELDGRRWPTVEHFYQAQKDPSPEHLARILAEEKPGRVKRLGKTCRARPDWDAIKEEVMRRGVRAKFEQNPHLAKLLDATGDRTLVEGNSWGNMFWGICRGRGQNKLGKIVENNFLCRIF